MIIKYFHKISDYVFKGISVKRIILNFLFIFFILFYQDFINSNIKNYLTPKVFNVNFIGTTVFIFILIIIVFGVAYKLFKQRYTVSINEINSVLITLFLILNFNYFNYNKNWKLSSFEILGFRIIFFDLFLIAISLIIILIVIYNCFYRKKKTQINSKKNYLLSDSPISNEVNDILDYQETVNSLTKIIINDNHNKSFTIGLVGPWGNGKSSVFQMVKKRLIKNDDCKINNFIVFDFLPYLNHKEDDIINEFFTSLGNELRPYSGKLSNLLSEYSSKLTDLYENKNILGFIENHVTNFKNSSANELYQLINEMLVDIDKKIIVFVDDLDRLNKNEILQVFKLIRNTADFRNTIFVVAMDKEYVLKSLKKSKKIFHSSFIDKFFQLEIYLPEIDKSKLKENFLLELNTSILNDGSPDFGYKIREAIDDEGNLFNDYVNNIRDVKRLVNQVIYDYPRTGGEINLKDFLNFTYFKLKFPNFITILKQGIGNIIELDNSGKYNLKEKKEKSNNSLGSKNILKFLSKKHSFNPKKYEFYNEDFFKNCLIEDQTIDCENKFLLLKTLAFMFGNENINDDVSSIKNENNLRILLEQKVPKYRLLNNEFNTLIHSYIENVIILVDEFFRDKKLEQLLSRFKFFTASKDEKEYKNAILALVYMFEKRKDFSLYDATMIEQISIFAQKLEDDEEGLNIDLKQWAVENIFKNPIFSIETRVLLLGHLRNGSLGNKFKVSYWRFKSYELDKLILVLFQEYLDNFASKITDVNDYSLYNVYHTVKTGIEKEVVERIIRFWKENSLELLCAQITDLDSWTTLSFKISNVINEFFETQINFIEFVKTQKDSNKPQIKEFLDLFKLLEISEFRYTCMCTFEKSTLMLAKIEHQKQFRRGRDENQGLIQLVLETNSLNLIECFRKEKEFERKYGSRIHEKQIGDLKFFYLFVYLKESISNNPVLTYTQELYHTILPFTDWEKTAFVSNNINNGENLIPQKNNDNYLKVISIEPRKNTNLN